MTVHEWGLLFGGALVGAAVLIAVACCLVAAGESRAEEAREQARLRADNAARRYTDICDDAAMRAVRRYADRAVADGEAFRATRDDIRALPEVER
jgi:hypothetical protein